MRQPVAGANLLLGAFAPASVISNDGPETLYLYRNSAVSATAYDAVVGPGGTATWPGGEVWGFSSSTIVNILNVGAGIESGSIAISGTVQTIAAGSGGSAGLAVRGNSIAQTSGTGISVGFSTPTETVVDDLLVACVRHNQGSTTATANPVTVPTGWTQVGGIIGPQGAACWSIITRKATSADASGAGNYTVGNVRDTSSKQLAVIVYAVSGATTVSGGNAGSFANGGVGATSNKPSASPAIQIIYATSSATAATYPTVTFQTTANSGPPAPQPSINSGKQIGISGGEYVTSYWFIGNWTNTASYDTAWTVSGTAYQRCFWVT